MAEVVSEPLAQVLAEVQAGDGLSPAAAGRLFPGHRGGKSVDPSTVFRWITGGTAAPDGRRVKLEAVRVGGRWITSRGAVARFVAALTAAADPAAPNPGAPVTRTPADRSHATAKAIDALKKMGA